jgi:hypothetical protein
MATVLLIHGINNQDNSKENIETQWAEALRKGATAAGLSIPDGTRFLAAFYGDILYQETESWDPDAEKPGVRAMSAKSPDEDYADDATAELYMEFQRKLNVTDDQVIAALEQGDEVPAHRRMARGIHKRWLKAIARVIENVLPTKGKYLARAFLRQAAAYLQKPGLKEKIDNLVKKQIFDGLVDDEDIIIISHSLGTIVAYSLMLRLRHQVQAKLLLSAGSPLGVVAVKKRLGPPLICLPNAGRWVNAADPEDFVALRPKLDASTFGCDQIVNLAQLDNGEEDAHSIVEYLSHAEVAWEVASLL